MAKESTDFILNSLRGRILLAVGALVVFNCFCGLLAYIAVSFLVSTPVYAVIAAIAAISAATAVFGWWLSTEILKPVEAVSLLALSLERSPTASLPKTTGATETDELLRTLHRNSQQLQNLISLMDDVASGKTEAAMKPLQNPDRLSISFQKLVSKVTDSIKAKQQLDALQSSVNRLKTDIGGIRSGNLAVDFRGDLWQVNEIAEAFKYLLGQFNELIRQVTSGSFSARRAVEDSRKSIRIVIESEDTHANRLKRAASSLKDSPERFKQLSGQLEEAIANVAASIMNRDADPALQIGAANRLRSHLIEIRRHLDKLRERTLAIPDAARTAQELARRRSNLVALNTSIHANGKYGNVSVLAEEITSLSTRAETVNRDILAINESLVAEIVQLETAIRSISEELSDVTDGITKSADSIADVERQMVDLVAVQAAISGYVNERFIEHESIVKTLTFDTQDNAAISLLKESDQNLVTIGNIADVLQDAVSDFRTANILQTEPQPNPVRVAPPIDLVKVPVES